MDELFQKAFDEAFDALKEYCDRSFEAFEARIEALEAKAPIKGDPGEKGDPGIGVDMTEVKAHIEQTIEGMRDSLKGDRGDVGPAVDESVLADNIHKMVSEAVAALPPAERGEPGEKGEPGKSLTLDEVMPAIEAKFDDLDSQMIIAVGGAVEEAVKALPPPEKGADADPELVRSLVAEVVESVLAGWERPKDGEPGKSVTIEDVMPAIEETITKAIAARPLPVSVKSGFIDRDNKLILAKSDGSLDVLGEVVGRDGHNGTDVDMDDVKAHITRMFEAIPKPKDGIGFEGMALDVRDGDGVYATWKAGDEHREQRLPVPIYRGVWKPDTVYYKGDMATWAGSCWHCLEDGTAKPETDAKAWKLAVKRGNDASPPKAKP